VTAGRLSPALLGAIVASAVSFWVCFAIVAGATRSAPSHATAAHPRRAAADVGVRLGLSPAPALRVRAVLLQGHAATASVQPATARTRPSTTTRAPAAPTRATPRPPPAVQPQPMAAPKPAATPQPVATRQVLASPEPNATAAPKRPGSKFDEVGPNPKSFDTIG
jgi:hypothetical protein